MRSLGQGRKEGSFAEFQKGGAHRECQVHESTHREGGSGRPGSLSACVLDHWALRRNRVCPHWAWKQSPGYRDPRWFTKHMSHSLASVNESVLCPGGHRAREAVGSARLTTPCLMPQGYEPAGTSQASHRKSGVGLSHVL